MTLSTRIRTARLAAGLRQSDLAARAGVSLSHVSCIEQGSRQPSTVVLGKLEQALGVKLRVHPARNYWSAEETRRLIQMNQAGYAIADIAAALGRPLQGTYTKLSKLRLSGRAPYRYPRVCAVEGCEARHHCRSLCRTHYNRAKRRQLPSVMRRAAG